jgi:hypothetical protein
MSINLVNPETVTGKVDAAANFVAQIRIALLCGDVNMAMKKVQEAERHLYNALEQLEEAGERQPAQEAIKPDPRESC